MTYLSFCQFFQVVILKCSRRNDVMMSEHFATCCLGSGFGFSLGHLGMKNMQLEKLHVFGKHNVSCLCFSIEYAFEGHPIA